MTSQAGDKGHGMGRQGGKKSEHKDGHMDRAEGSEVGNSGRRACKCRPGRRGHGPRTEEEKMAHAAGERKNHQEGEMRSDGKRSMGEGKTQMRQRSMGDRRQGNSHGGSSNREAGQKKYGKSKQMKEMKGSQGEGQRGCRCGPRGGRGGKGGKGGKGNHWSQHSENKTEVSCITATLF